VKIYCPIIGRLLLTKEIKKEVENGANGIVITHGTDTMHYTASALSFMIDTNIPIVLVGAQRSSDRPSSDAALNLIIIIRNNFLMEIRTNNKNIEKSPLIEVLCY